jgi:Zn-dependent protease/CBS domain-containing protein
VQLSWKIGRLFGIDLFIHVTFPLMVIWVAWQFYQTLGTLAAAAYGVVFILSVFAIVVLHELGHALTARRFGIATRDIILLPIGGVARLERMPDDPKQELLIAVAGPAVNVVLAALCALIILALGQRPLLGLALLADGGYVSQLLTVNITLIVFNALPAFPMDGGRVLRALLAMKLSYARATNIAANVGKTFAVLFVLVGFMTQNIVLIFIAFFVWMGASGEASVARFRNDVGDADVDSITIRDVFTLAPDDPLDKGVDSVLAGFQQDLPVVDQGRLVGLLTREDLLKALHNQGRSGLVRDAMRATVPTVAPADRIEEAFQKLQTAGLRTIPVIDDGHFAGVVSTENIAEYLMVQSALRERRD